MDGYPHMIRSIAYELFNRLTTDPDALRKQVAAARRDRDAVETELLDAKQMIETISETKLFSRRKLEADNATMTTRIEELTAERDALQLQVNELQLLVMSLPSAVDSTKQAAELAQANLEIARLQKAYANFKGTDLTIEPTWILAAWSVSGSEWTEVKRGGYDSMLAEMRRNATSWNLFPRSAWDALVKNGRAR